MADPIDAYKVLQVDAEAEDEVIRAAYRRLARKHHPDLAPGPEAAGRMAAINTAWTLVATPSARAAYDRSRAGSSEPRTHGPAPPQGRHSQARGDGGVPRREGAPGRAADVGASEGEPPPSAGQRTSTGARSTDTPPNPHPPGTVSRDWTSGRSTVGGGFDRSMRSPDGRGAAGPPPGRPSGSVLNFGRYSGWSLGEIARQDLDYMEWLDRTPIGRAYRDEIDSILRTAGRRRSASTDATERRGLFRRR